jgi:aldose 1-epimerase
LPQRMSFLTLKHKDQVLTIQRIGAGIAQYYIQRDDIKYHICYGFSDEKDKESCMGDNLFPWPGRIENQHYEWKGKEYSVKGHASMVDANNNALHGFVNTMEWKFDQQSENKVVALVEIDEKVFEKKGYPFSLSLQLVYVLSDNGLEVEALVKNTGSHIAPWGIGFHPYFTIDDQIVDNLELKIPSTSLIEYDSVLKPTGKLIDVSNREHPYSFHDFKQISNTIFDHCYVNLESDDNGIAKTTLRYKDKTITVWQQVSSYPYCQVYSYDFSKKGNKRRGFAIEPESCCGFAFNVKDMGLGELSPGEEFKGKWGIEFKF